MTLSHSWNLTSWNSRFWSCFQTDMVPSCAAKLLCPTARESKIKQNGCLLVHEPWRTFFWPPLLFEVQFLLENSYSKLIVPVLWDHPWNNYLVGCLLSIHIIYSYPIAYSIKKWATLAGILDGWMLGRPSDDMLTLHFCELARSTCDDWKVFSVMVIWL